MKKLLVLFSIIILSACGQKKATPDIGLVISTLNNPFFVELKKGAESAAQLAGHTISVLDSQNDAAKELANIEDLISAKVKVLLINPTDSDSSARATQLAMEAGIPVISLDRTINGVSVATHIASDNMQGGAMAAELLSKVLKNPKAKIVELEGIPGTSAARERGQGFNTKAAELGLNVAIKQTANFDRSQGLTVMENILQANPDIEAIFAHNDEMALGAQRAIQDAGLTNIQIIGFDATPDAIAAVEEGTITATIAQRPELIGQLGVENAIHVIKGETIPNKIPVGLFFVKKERIVSNNKNITLYNL